MHQLKQEHQVFGQHTQELPSGMLLMYYIQAHHPLRDS